TYGDQNTNISKALKSIDDIYRNETAPILLLSDGNQTLGSDYEFSSKTLNQPVYPIILGDSTIYTDLRIELLNTNRYAFLKNQFPVEVVLSYKGERPVRSSFVISQGNSQLFRQNVEFSENDNTITLNLTLPASAVGLQQYTATILPLEEERNTLNNTQRFAVEVIDQATNILVVSDVVHPDLGALKKSITSNDQRTFTLLTSSEAVSKLTEFQLVILYQPSSRFAAVFEEIDNQKKNTLLITGINTDWNFLASVQDRYDKEITNQTEEISGILNPNYGMFAVEDIGWNDFPPLSTQFGQLTINSPHEILLEQSINGFASEAPLLATLESNGERHAIFDAEGLWKWRAHSFLLNENFEAFDEWMAKLMQFLASSERRSRLEVNSEPFYYNNNRVMISAQYFDKNYVFDQRASLRINLINKDTDERIVYPMLLNNNFFEVDLNNLPAGNYTYTVVVEEEGVSRSGTFTLLDFNVEQQFDNANVTKLHRLATNTTGEAFFPSQLQDLIDSLVDNEAYKAIQKSEQKTVPLIDWKYLLALIILSLSLEWFIRKYNGLI
ncbi:MAG: VWA domain-containing protein, partial [Flavobacteriaceae bacterium]|nr:VWA domain-containing protein [Flavobacteriaceae bacterium]